MYKKTTAFKKDMYSLYKKITEHFLVYQNSQAWQQIKKCALELVITDIIPD